MEQLVPKDEAATLDNSYTGAPRNPTERRSFLHFKADRHIP
jgi:hypothetical protein